jgi:hypothetical protein
VEGEVRWAGKLRCKKAEATGGREAKLKHVVAELTLDNRALKDVLPRNF